MNTTHTFRSGLHTVLIGMVILGMATLFVVPNLADAQDEDEVVTDATETSLEDGELDIGGSEGDLGYEPLTSGDIPAFDGQEDGVDIGAYLSGVFTMVISITTVIAVVLLTVAGFKWLTAGDSESRVTDAKNQIKGAAGGLLLAAAAWLILYTINPAILNFQLSPDTVTEGSDECPTEAIDEPRSGHGYYIKTEYDFPPSWKGCAGQLLKREYRKAEPVLCRGVDDCINNSGYTESGKDRWDCGEFINSWIDERISKARADHVSVQCQTIDDGRADPAPGFYFATDTDIPNPDLIFQIYELNHAIGGFDASFRGYFGPYRQGTECWNDRTGPDDNMWFYINHGNPLDYDFVHYLGCREIEPDRAAYEIFNPEWFGDPTMRGISSSDAPPDPKNGTAVYRRVHVERPGWGTDTDEWYGPFRSPSQCDAESGEIRQAFEDTYPEDTTIELEDCWLDYEAVEEYGTPDFEDVS